MLKCIDSWESHCVECGEPDCYRSCVKYRPSKTGRCERMRKFGKFGTIGRYGWVSFLEWGKLELLWHGGMADGWVALFARGLNCLFEPAALALGPSFYRVFRSVRWRVGKVMAWHRTQPAIWCVAVECECEERLRLILRDRNLTVVGEWSLVTRAGRGEVGIVLPKIEEGALFSIFPDGAAASGKIRFIKNELALDPSHFSSIISGSSPKCIAWDLDGVIWDGTLSEGEDVKLRLDVMEAVKRLDEQGVVSSICSKNDPNVAFVKLKELGIEEWFVFPQINWGPKSESLKNLAKEMSIGLDAIAFVDDREENRAEVRANAEGVRVYAETEVAKLIHECSSSADGSGGGELGSRRRLMYRKEECRRRAEWTFPGDASQFLAQSELKVELLSVEGERVARCRELVRRTNQLTITARRYSEDAFANLLRSCETRAVRVWDKYGDYGVVGFVAWNEAQIVELVFSCRVAQKGVERWVLDSLPKGLSVEMVETERNAPIRKIVAEWLKERS